MDPTLNPYRPARLLLGLDLGQMGDPTALAVLERDMVLVGHKLEPRFVVRFLERVPLRTPYPTIVRGVKTRLLELREPCMLVVDQTGVGRPVVDLFRETTLTPGHKMTPVGITITAGKKIKPTERWDEWHVPKRDMILCLQVTIQQQRLVMPRTLPEGETLIKEAENFSYKLSQAGNDLYGAWREGQHDDLLLAVAIAVWWGTKVAPVQPEETRQRYATAAGNLLTRRGRVGVHSGAGLTQVATGRY